MNHIVQPKEETKPNPKRVVGVFATVFFFLCVCLALSAGVYGCGDDEESEVSDAIAALDKSSPKSFCSAREAKVQSCRGTGGFFDVDDISEECEEDRPEGCLEAEVPFYQCLLALPCETADEDAVNAACGAQWEARTAALAQLAEDGVDCSVGEESVGNNSSIPYF